MPTYNLILHPAQNDPHRVSLSDDTVDWFTATIEAADLAQAVTHATNTYPRHTVVSAEEQYKTHTITDKRLDRLLSRVHWDWPDNKPVITSPDYHDTVRFIAEILDLVIPNLMLSAFDEEDGAFLGVYNAATDTYRTIYIKDHELTIDPDACGREGLRCIARGIIRLANHLQ